MKKDDPARSAPATAAELMALADRCEREEPSSTLDRAIWCEINHAAFAHALQRSSEEIARARGNGLTNRDDACVRYAFMSCPRYTTSLDSAVTLRPEGFAWSVAQDQTATADVNKWGEISVRGIAKTGAMALCSAALRARAAVVECSSDTKGKAGVARKGSRRTVAGRSAQ